MSDPTTPEARARGAHKQLRLLLEHDLDDHPAQYARISVRSTEAVLDYYGADYPRVDVGGRDDLEQCSLCGTTGMVERIHGLACPHDAVEEDG